MRKAKKIENVNTQERLHTIGALINDARQQGLSQPQKRRTALKRNPGIDERNAKDEALLLQTKRQKTANIQSKVKLYEKLSKGEINLGEEDKNYLVDFESKKPEVEYNEQDIYLALQEFYSKHKVHNLTHQDYKSLVEVVQTQGLGFLNEKLRGKYRDEIQIKPKERLLSSSIHTVQIPIVPSSRKLRREILERKLEEKNKQVQELFNVS